MSPLPDFAAAFATTRQSFIRAIEEARSGNSTLWKQTNDTR